MQLIFDSNEQVDTQWTYIKNKKALQLNSHMAFLFWRIGDSNS